MKTILHLCADTGSDSKPYAENGYRVIRVGSDIGVENWDTETIKSTEEMYGKIYGIFANPPCLEFSRARTGGVPRLGDSGMFLVKECQRIIEECKKSGGLKFWKTTVRIPTMVVRVTLDKEDRIVG